MLWDAKVINQLQRVTLVQERGQELVTIGRVRIVYLDPRANLDELNRRLCLRQYSGQ